MRQRLFVTSTGTGIGKSFITAGLVRQARALGKSVAAYKPLISGFDIDSPKDSDTGLLLDALGKPVTPGTVDEISPWRFTAPLAPTMAARQEGRTISFDELVAFGQKAMQGPEETVFIEGVGGVMAPVAEHYTVIDWIEALTADTILVTGSYLGTISHTLTALSVLEQRAIPVFAVIVNQSEESSVSLEATIDELENWTRLPLVGIKRRKAGDDMKTLPELQGLFS